MAVIEEALRQLLLDDATVSGLVDTRIYPLVIPQSAELPAIAYQRISGPRVHSHDGVSGLARPRIQYACKATSYSGAKLLANAVRSALDGYSGVVSVGGGSVDIDSVLLATEIDSYSDATAEEASAWLVIVDFIAWHHE